MPTSHLDNYEALHEFLHTRGREVPRKKLASNTYAERRGGAIAVRLHATDVLTFTPQRITMHNGGYLTPVTMERITRYLPAPWCVRSNGGAWRLQHGFQYKPEDAHQVVPWVEGISLHRIGNGFWALDRDTCLSEDEQERQERHNTAARKHVARYLKAYTTEDTDDDSDCVLCHQHSLVPRAMGGEQIVTIGDAMGDVQHLIDHVHSGEINEHLIRAAVSGSGYKVTSATLLGHDTVKRCLRVYLLNRLLIGNAVTNHGRKPVPTPKESAA